MALHSCLLCLGSNFNRFACMTSARKAIEAYFPAIRFATETETEAFGNGFLSPFSNQVAWMETPLSIGEVRTLLKRIEQDNGRLPDDKKRGIVRMDIDLLRYDCEVLKPADMAKDYVQCGMKELGL